MTRKIVRIPVCEKSTYERNVEIHNWIHTHFEKLPLSCEFLYRHLPWSDGKWHTGSSEEIAAIDFENKEDATAFAIWLGVGIG